MLLSTWDHSLFLEVSKPSACYSWQSENLMSVFCLLVSCTKCIWAQFSLCWCPAMEGWKADEAPCHPSTWPHRPEVCWGLSDCCLISLPHWFALSVCFHFRQVLCCEKCWMGLGERSAKWHNSFKKYGPLQSLVKAVSKQFTVLQDCGVFGWC